jgi:hypothetical protein
VPDAFHERQYKSQYDRHAGAAKAALKRLIEDAGDALRGMERGDRPGVWNLTETALQYERNAARLNAIKELKEVFDTHD